MTKILQLVGVKNSPEEVYKALTTIEGLSGWWTKTTSGKAGQGDIIHFQFGGMSDDMEVIEAVPDKKVRWKCISGSDEWIGSYLTFDIIKKEDQTHIRFCQDNFAGEDCSASVRFSS